MSFNSTVESLWNLVKDVHQLLRELTTPKWCKRQNPILTIREVHSQTRFWGKYREYLAITNQKKIRLKSPSVLNYKILKMTVITLGRERIIHI
jgi:hypothetical protein